MSGKLKFGGDWVKFIRKSLFFQTIPDKVEGVSKVIKRN